MNIVEGGCRLYAESTTCRWYAVHLATPCDSQVYGGLPNGLACHRDKALNPTRLHFIRSTELPGNIVVIAITIFFFFLQSAQAHKDADSPATHAPSPTKPAQPGSRINDCVISFILGSR